MFFSHSQMTNDDRAMITMMMAVQAVGILITDSGD